MARLANHLGVALAALLALLVLAAPAGAVTYPTGFAESNLVTGLTQPTKVAFAPDGRRFIAEKGGKLKVAAPGASTGTEVLDLSARVNTYGDRGLLGLALDASFGSNGYVYLLYTYELNPLSPDGSGQMVSRLSRFTVSPTNVVSNETTLLGFNVSGVCPAPSNTVDCIPSEGWSHSIGTVISAPDGTLWVGSGDASSYTAVDPLAFRVYDEQSMAGKIMHLDRDGRGLPGHSFCPSETDLTKVCTKLFAKGFRNPFRFHLQPSGRLTVGDVGWERREEVDFIATGGRSYGWPCYEGVSHTNGYQDRAECTPEFAKEGTANAHLGPVYDYPHSGSNSVVGGPTYGGSSYPADYAGDVFFGDYSAGFLKKINLDNAGNFASVDNFATSWSGVDIQSAPNGDLVYVSFGTGAPGTGAIKRIAYTPANGVPTAAASGNPTSGSSPLTVAFTGSGSSDPDNDPLTYDWDFGDGTAHSTVANPSHTYNAGGNYTATLTVSDGRGGTDSESVAISVGNTPPVATITSPASTLRYQAGDTISLAGTAQDPEQGALPGSAYTWTVILRHIDHVHPLSQFVGQATASFAAGSDHDSDSQYEITLTVRDAGGLTDSETVIVRPQTSAFRIESVPSGAPVTYAGSGQTTPFAHDSAVGFRTTVSAASSFTTAGRTYVFTSWSDGGARQHDITIPATALTLTAQYTESTAGGPVAAYGFEESSGAIAQDATGRGNAGAISGAARTAGGRHGAALDFDGIDDWVSVPDSSSLDMTGAMTLSAWIKPEVLGSWDTAIMKEAPGDSAYGLWATGSSGGRPNAWIGSAGIYSPTGIAAGAWVHVAVTSDATTERLYINGALVATAPAALAPSSTQPLRIGGNAVWAGEFFDGVIDDVRIYDRALSAADVATDMSAAVGTPTVPGDTTPPTVSVTAPAANATVSGTSTLAANAADAGGVESVQFRIDGNAVGAPDTAAPYQVAWDSSTVANGSHTVTAVARDVAGNSATSAGVTFNVSNSVAAGAPVASYAFNEGAGATANDASGHGNHGTVAGATWTAAGKNGSALDFDGTNDWVTVADSPSLDLSNRVTLSAWVKPDTRGSYDTVVFKELGSDLAYALYSSSSSLAKPNGWLGGTGIYSPIEIPIGSWSHLAFSYDGSVARLYVNGTQIGSLATTTASAPPSSLPLRIGGNAVWADEFFDGTIDDVRVYDRALTAAEIGADMGASVRVAAAGARSLSRSVRSSATTRAGRRVARGGRLRRKAVRKLSCVRVRPSADDTKRRSRRRGQRAWQLRCR